MLTDKDRAIICGKISNIVLGWVKSGKARADDVADAMPVLHEELARITTEEEMLTYLAKYTAQDSGIEPVYTWYCNKVLGVNK